MTVALSIIIGLLLVFCWYQEHAHEREMAAARARWAEPEPLPLVVPRGAGWGTLMDLAATQLARAPLPPAASIGRLPAFTLPQFSAVFPPGKD